MPNCAPIAALAFTCLSVCCQELQPLPAFDQPKVPAGYLVTLPAGYSPERRWPLIVDLHGAIDPARNGAAVTQQRLWSRATGEVPAIVVSLAGRTRSWGTLRGERDDVAYALAALDAVAGSHAVDPQRVYLAGFSSGADFVCQGGLQATGRFAASMPVCPGPPNVVGLQDGVLVGKRDRPFCFVTGEEDWIRKDGAWQAFVAFDAAGGRAMYREVPGVAHAFAEPAEYGRLFAHLELMTRPVDQLDHLGIARSALQRDDWLCASTHLLALGDHAEAKALLQDIERRGRELQAAASAIDAAQEPGRAFEAWWRVRTQFHRFPALAQAAQAQLDELRKLDNRTLGRARAAWFKSRGAQQPQPKQQPGPKQQPEPKQQPGQQQQPDKEQPAEQTPQPTNDRQAGQRQPRHRSSGQPPSGQQPPGQHQGQNEPMQLQHQGQEERKGPEEQQPAPQAQPREERQSQTQHPSPATASPSAPAGPLWTFDRYLSYDDLTAHVRDLAARFPERVQLSSIGRSLEGRELWLLEICDRSTGPAAAKPAAFVQACLHGNEIDALTTVLYFAWQLAANPDRKRGNDRLLRDTAVYLLPAANPDAVQRFCSEPYSCWRPRYNMRPFDSDGDGRVDEDGSEDLDGDGEIGLMYLAVPDGEYVLSDGALRRRRPGEQGQGYQLIGREGTDDDGDGKYGEDPRGGVDLNRNFPQGFGSGGRFEGSNGQAALSEPETAAIAAFVREHPNIGLFLDYHNDARCVFYWQGEAAADLPLLQGFAGRAEAELGYPGKPLTHAGAGLAIAWAYGQLGIPAFLIELEAHRGDDAEQYLRTAWQDAWQVPRPFRHPQLGDILLGNDWKKLPKRNPAPQDIVWQASRNWDFARGEIGALPHLELRELRLQPQPWGLAVRGVVRNKGRMPTDCAAAVRAGTSTPLRLSATGASLRGDVELRALAPGGEAAFAVEARELQDGAVLSVQHPRAGRVQVRLQRPRGATVAVRTDYRIEDGYATPDRAVLADNAFYRAGRSEAERGPVFARRRGPGPLRLAVLLGEWHDLRHQHEPEAFRRALFSDGEYTGTSPTGQQVYGSLADVYREMSYGRTAVSGEVFGWFELPGDHADYRDAGFGSSIVQDRLLAAVRQRHGERALDGFDGIAFVWAGNAVSRTSALWPMRLSLREPAGVAAFKTGELHQGEFLPVGVPCHELAHTFGVDDKYGLGATVDPFGPFCLMARGTHGGEPSARHRPFPLCAWCRMVIGWLQPAVIDPGVPQRLALRPVLSAPTECFRVLLRPDGSEYLLLENRRREGCCTDLPSKGLLVLHVGPPVAGGAPQKQVRLLPAHGLRARGGDPVHPEAVAWPQPGHDELQVGGVRLSHIRLVDDVVYFEVGAAAGR